MRLVLTDSTCLRDSISIISDIVNEGRFKIGKDCIELVAMDPANVAMVVFKLLPTAFAEYDVPKDTEIALNLANFKQILKRAKANDILSLELSDSSKLNIALKGSNARTFSLPLLELEEREQKVPNLSFPVSISMHSTTLTDAIEDASVVAESVTFIAQPESFTVSAEGDLSKAHVEMPHGDETKVITNTKATVKSKYSIEYLKKMMQASKLADSVAVHFNQDYPLKLEYKAVDKLSLSFILAPRVEND